MTDESDPHDRAPATEDVPSYTRTPVAMLGPEQRALAQRARDNADQAPGDLRNTGGALGAP
ncbi:MAG: hypothetical protein IAG13_36275, partial [Deltaproteobacteria bacterium]|nr:hypothetical protein [Nannocystaceae bacterium]